LSLPGVRAIRGLIEINREAAAALLHNIPVIPACIDRNPSLEAPPPRPRAGASMDRVAPDPSRSRVKPGTSEHESLSTQSGIMPCERLRRTTARL
jgi:hypothetical protein